MSVDKLKGFTKTYGLYLIPFITSFLYFWKVSEVSFWFDELVTLNTAAYTDFNQFFGNYFSNQLHPPLYFLSLKVFYAITEYGTNCNELLWMVIYLFTHTLKSALGSLCLYNDSFFTQTYVQFFSQNLLYHLDRINEFSIRFISALSMTAVSVLIFDFFKKNKFVLLAVVLCAYMGLNVAFINYAQDARPYALMSFISLLVFFEFNRSFDKELSLHNFKRLILLNILMLLTHYFSIFIILAEIIVFAFKNFKKNKQSAVLAALVFLIMVLFSYFYKFYGVAGKIPILSSVDFNSLRIIFQTFVATPSAFFVFTVAALTLILKRIFKIKSLLDAILYKTLVFVSLVILILALISLFWPVFNIRYLMPLASLFGVLYCGIFYLFSETVFSFVKDFKLKQAAIAVLFIVLAVRILEGQHRNTFFLANYYKNQKYYFIEDAYKNVVQDKDYTDQAAYILEEHMPEYFRYYEDKYRLRKLAALPPAQAINQKQNEIGKLQSESLPATIYYIQVLHDNLSTQKELVQLKNYTANRIFSKNNIRLFKFTINN